MNLGEEKAINSGTRTLHRHRFGSFQVYTVIAFQTFEEKEEDEEEDRHFSQLIDLARR